MIARLLACLCLLAGPALAQPVNDAAILAERPARLLSAYRLFTDGPAQTPNTGVIPYRLNTPLFTDYADKQRFFYLPAGRAARFNGREALAFPVGSVLIKSFSYGARPIETRLLIHRRDGWVAWAYVWDAALGDAVLKVAGARLPVAFTDPSGRAREVRYQVPNRNQCKGCHVMDGVFSPIGPTARNLNRDGQLEAWRAAGLVSGLPDDPPLMPAWDDAAAGIGARARAYLDVNCAHCHRPEGPASTSGLMLTWWEDNPVAWGRYKRPVAAGRGSGGLEFDIAPGDPDASILLYRMTATDPGVMMPELGRTIPHDEGAALIRDWIAGMD